MNIPIDDYLSKKLRAISFGAVVLVVFIHSQNEEIKFASGELTGGSSYYVLFAENFVSKGIARIAPPIFFAISGLLFYKSFDVTLSTVAHKLKTRFKSLVIPYIFWSVFGLMITLALQLVPWSKNFFTRELVVNYTFSKLMLVIIWDPLPYQLWFVRDLIMLTLLSPVIWYLTKSIRVVWLVILLFLWTFASKTFELFSNEALLFFVIGCALTFDGDNLLNCRFSKFLTYALFVSWLLIVSLSTYLLTFNQLTLILKALNNLGILVGIISVWSLYDHFNQEHMARYSALFGSSFFIFVFHEPLLTILKKAMFYLTGKTDITSLLIYLLAPMTAIGMSILARYLMRRGTPRLYNFATGGR